MHRQQSATDTPPSFASCRGRKHSLRIEPSPAGVARFKGQLATITGVPFEQQSQVTFKCKAPGTGGWGDATLLLSSG